MNKIVKEIRYIANIGDCCKTLSVVNIKEMKHFCSFKIVVCQKGT